VQQLSSKWGGYGAPEIPGAMLALLFKIVSPTIGLWPPLG